MHNLQFKAGLYRIWCGVHTLGDTSAFVNQAGQLLLIAINSGLIAEWMASALYLNSIQPLFNLLEIKTLSYVVQWTLITGDTPGVIIILPGGYTRASENIDRPLELETVPFFLGAWSVVALMTSYYCSNNLGIRLVP